MIEYMNIPVLVCVSLLGVGAFVMIVGSLLKKQWATDGKKTSLSIYLLYLLAMSGSGWTWYNSIHKARVQSPNQKIPDRKTKCVIKTHINIKQNVIFGAKLKPV